MKKRLTVEKKKKGEGRAETEERKGKCDEEESEQGKQDGHAMQLNRWWAQRVVRFIPLTKEGAFFPSNMVHEHVCICPLLAQWC